MNTTIGLKVVAGLEGVSMEDEDIRLLQQAELDLSTDIPSPPPVLFQGDKTMISKGDFSVVVGAAKSRKTFCVSAMVGAYLCADEHMNMCPLDRYRAKCLPRSQSCKACLPDCWITNQPEDGTVPDALFSGIHARQTARTDR